MKKTTIWIAVAACAILLCGCSHSEEPVARTSFGNAVEDNQGELDAGSHSFSESEESQPESSKPVESAAPSSEPLDLHLSDAESEGMFQLVYHVQGLPCAVYGITVSKTPLDGT